MVDHNVCSFLCICTFLFICFYGTENYHYCQLLVIVEKSIYSPKILAAQKNLNLECVCL